MVMVTTSIHLEWWELSSFLCPGLGQPLPPCWVLKGREVSIRSLCGDHLVRQNPCSLFTFWAREWELTGLWHWAKVWYQVFWLYFSDPFHECFSRVGSQRDQTPGGPGWGGGFSRGSETFPVEWLMMHSEEKSESFDTEIYLTAQRECLLLVP